MFKIDPQYKTIHLTRGDIAIFEVSTVNEATGEEYVFVSGDIVRLKVYEKADCGCVVLQKDTAVSGETKVVDIALSSNDTKIGEIISKPKKYWFEIELNPETAPQTIIGYDEDGAKEFILYPEGSDQK